MSEEVGFHVSNKKTWKTGGLNRKKSIEKQMNEANVYLLLWVDHHDEAYQWAEKKRCILNHTRPK